MYLSIMSSVTNLFSTFMYSGLSICVCKNISLKSKSMNLVPLCASEITPLSSSFVSSKLVAVELVFILECNLSTPTTSFILYYSTLRGQ